jgi:hypothetical protein
LALIIQGNRPCCIPCSHEPPMPESPYCCCIHVAPAFPPSEPPMPEGPSGVPSPAWGLRSPGSCPGCQVGTCMCLPTCPLSLCGFPLALCPTAFRRCFLKVTGPVLFYMVYAAPSFPPYEPACAGGRTACPYVASLWLGPLFPRVVPRVPGWHLYLPPHMPHPVPKRRWPSARARMRRGWRNGAGELGQQQLVRDRIIVFNTPRAHASGRLPACFCPCPWQCAVLLSCRASCSASQSGCSTRPRLQHPALAPQHS